MSRRSDRIHVMNVLFQMEFHSMDELEEILEIYINEEKNLARVDQDYVAKEVLGVKEHITAIDQLIDAFAIDWSISRISKMDLAILRLGIYEMLYNEDIPEGVAINEAVELAKLYSSEESYSFINGILGRISRRER